MDLHEALRKADCLVDAMRPFCDRIEIAGSIRRRKPQVKDIEIVAVPNVTLYDEPDGLFDTKQVPCNALHVWAMTTDLVRWIKPGTSEILDWEPKADGRYWRGLLPNGAKLDLFLTTPERFGATYLIRTGSAEFSQSVVMYGRAIGHRFMEGGLTAGYEAAAPMNTPEEADVFRILGLQFVPPEQRHDGRALKRLGVSNASL